MKKNYITPKIKIAGTELICSANAASIMNGGEFTPHYEIPDVDTEFDVGTKNRFYGDSDDSWE